MGKKSKTNLEQDLANNQNFQESLLNQHLEKAFNLNSSLFLYPIIHYNVASSWHLPRLIAAYEPDCILVELPNTLNKKLDIFRNPQLVPPVALYAKTYIDPKISDQDLAYCSQVVTDSVAEQNTLEPNEDLDLFLEEENNETDLDLEKSLQQAQDSLDDFFHEPQTDALQEDSKNFFYIPLLHFSPEYVALKYALNHNVPVQCIDLGSFDSRIINQDNLSFVDDMFRFTNALLEQDSSLTLSQFFDKHFVSQGLAQDSLTFLKNLYSLAFTLRSGLDESKEILTVQRELCMLKAIKDAQKQYSRILVITGAIHSVALCDYLYFKKPKATALKFSKPKEDLLLIPFAFVEQSDSKVRAPIDFINYYNKLFKNLTLLTKEFFRYGDFVLDEYFSKYINKDLGLVLAKSKNKETKEKEKLFLQHYQNYQQQLDVELQKQQLLAAEHLQNNIDRSSLLTLNAEQQQTLLSKIASAFDDTNNYFINQIPKKDQSLSLISTALKIDWQKMMFNLANLRDKPFADVYELLDCALSTFIKESYTEDPPLIKQLKNKLNTINSGFVLDNVNTPPLLQDLMAQAKSCGLKLPQNTEVKVNVKVTDNLKNLQKSQLIYRIAFVSNNFLLSKPQMKVENAYEIKRTETFTYKYSDQVLLDLIYQSAKANNLYDLCLMIVKEKLQQPTLSLIELGDLLESCTNMGMSQLFISLQALINQLISREHTIYNISKVLDQLNNYTFVSKIGKTEKPILEQLFDNFVLHICAILQQTDSIYEDNFDEFIKAINTINYRVKRLPGSKKLISDTTNLSTILDNIGKNKVTHTLPLAKKPNLDEQDLLDQNNIVELQQDLQKSLALDFQSLLNEKHTFAKAYHQSIKNILSFADNKVKASFYLCLLHQLQQPQLSPFLVGAYLAILYKNNFCQYDNFIYYVQKTVQSSFIDKDQSLDFFYALLSISKDSLFYRTHILKILNEYLDSLSLSEFLKVLIYFKRAFVNLSNRQLYKVKEQLQHLLGQSIEPVEFEVSDEQVAINMSFNQKMTNDFNLYFTPQFQAKNDK